MIISTTPIPLLQVPQYPPQQVSFLSSYFWVCVYVRLKKKYNLLSLDSAVLVCTGVGP